MCRNEDRTAILERTALLIGQDGVDRLAGCRVAVVGLGGVGGHCAEALARAGVGALHLVDADTVAMSNLNRQLVATFDTIGMKKPDAMERRLRAVSRCAITKSDAFVLPDTVADALPGAFDFVVDAIDTLSGKLALVDFCRERGIPMISCMGAGNRLDAARFSVRDIYQTEGCPLARRMRGELRKRGVMALPVVFSDEPSHAAPGQTAIGSLAPVTATAGLLAADYAILTLLGAAAARD